MSIDPITSAEFIALEKKFHVGEINRLPSRHNIEYKHWLERRFLLRLGVALPQWDDSRRRTWVAHLLEQYFWKELGLPQRPPFFCWSIPVFLWSDSFCPPPIDVKALAERLQRLSPGESSPLCTAERKFALLEKRLHLERAEVELLQLAFATSWLGSSPSQDIAVPLNAVLCEVLSNLGSAIPEERNALYCQLLNVSVEELAPVFDRPALVAMHLLEHEDWQEGRPYEATDKLLSIVQGHYLTHAALIEDLKAAEPSIFVVLDTDFPIDALCEGAPADIADVFRAARKGHTLSSAQQETLVHWHTGLHVNLVNIDRAVPLENYEQAICCVIESTVNIRLRGERFCADRLVIEMGNCLSSS